MWRSRTQKRRLLRGYRRTVGTLGPFGPLQNPLEDDCLLEGKICTFNLELRLCVDRVITCEEILAITRVASEKAVALKL